MMRGSREHRGDPLAEQVRGCFVTFGILLLATMATVVSFLIGC